MLKITVIAKVKISEPINRFDAPKFFLTTDDYFCIRIEMIRDHLLISTGVNYSPGLIQCHC